MSRAKPQTSSKKRKHEVKDAEPPTPLSPAKKQRTEDFDSSIAMLDPSLLADHFAKAIKKYNKNSTSTELEEQYLSSSAFTDTTEFSQPREKEAFPEFLQSFIKDADEIKKSSEEKGSPHTIVITQSGIRSADVARAIRTFRTEENGIAKLFAKHMKLREQVEYLEKTRIGFGVGTPHRINELITSGALKTTELKRVVIDGSYINEKKQGLWSMKEVLQPMLDLLHGEKIEERLREGSTTILVF